MLHIFHMPRLFHMAYSPLGRMIRQRVPDARRAENLFILWVTALLMVLMFLNQIAWAFVHDAIVADPGGAVAIRFWLGQLGFILAFCFTCGIGFKPALTLTCSQTALHIQGADTDTVIAYHDIESAEFISALVFHRHFRRYATTRVFVNRLEDELVLLHTKDGPVVLGLTTPDREAFETYLGARLGLVEPAPVLDLEPAQVA